VSDHYFSPDPESPERRELVNATVWGRPMTLVSSSGVFAAGRVDLGTGVLFRTVGPPTSPGRYLDLGCGYGVIACAIAGAVADAEVWGVDVNERALRLARENARSMGVADRLFAVTPDDVPEGLEFDEIWSNPPIRIGKAALHSLLLTWLPRLRMGGHANLVVGRNLGADSLQRWLVEQGYPCERLGSAKGFRVLRCVRTG
jgi:16S rRNA (guanine1207-N2)-methyltransferase